MSPFQTAKLWFVEGSGLAKDALHIYVGLALFLGTIALFGWRADGCKPWGLVLAAALAGEVWDIVDTIGIGRPVILANHWHDVWNTLFWPSAIVLLVKVRTLRLTGARSCK